MVSWHSDPSLTSASASRVTLSLPDKTQSSPLGLYSSFPSFERVCEPGNPIYSPVRSLNAPLSAETITRPTGKCGGVLDIRLILHAPCERLRAEQVSRLICSGPCIPPMQPMDAIQRMLRYISIHGQSPVNQMVKVSDKKRCHWDFKGQPAVNPEKTATAGRQAASSASWRKRLGCQRVPVLTALEERTFIAFWWGPALNRSNPK